MKIRTQRLAGGRPNTRRLLAVNTVSAAVAMILSGAGPAFAQEATSAQAATTEDLTEIDEVVVSGIRHGIESSITSKKNSTRSWNPSPPRTSANYPTPASPNPSRACRVSPRNASTAARR